LRCPGLSELPPPPPGRTGWPWTEEAPQLPDTMPDGRPWPRISIVTPNYNQGRFIEESIRSILLQGYPELEYFIFDSVSSDDSVEIIKKYEPWLAYWASEPDRGQSHAINKGLARSTGQLFNWHNADDILTAGSLTKTADVMMHHPEAGYVHGYAIVIDSQSKVIYHNYGLFHGSSGFVMDLGWSFANLKAGCQPGCLMDRKLVSKIGGVDEGNVFIMDLDICLRLALVRPPYYIDHPLVYYRKYAEAKSSSRQQERANARLDLAAKLFSIQDLPPAIRKLKRKAMATAHWYAVKCYTEVKMCRPALRNMLKNTFYQPLGYWPLRLLTLYRMAWWILPPGLAPKPKTDSFDPTDRPINR